MELKAQENVFNQYCYMSHSSEMLEMLLTYISLLWFGLWHFVFLLCSHPNSLGEAILQK